jgi:DNA-binding winged helix-turn-helix (wHTH) protein/Tol biopolymer transport system component
MPEEIHRESSSGVLRFGEYELDPKRGVLSRKGIPLKIQPQPLRVLELLLLRAPAMVTREELSDYVWGNGVNVDLDQSLNFCVRQIRSVLNDSASDPKFIDTLPKQGYRFVGDVVRETAPVSAAVASSIAGEPEPPHEAVPDAPQPVTRRTFAWSAAAVAAGVVGGGAWLARSHRRTSSPKAVTVVIPLPEGATNADPLRIIGSVAVAPDGSAIAIPLKTADTTYLYLRRLDSNRLMRLEGSEPSAPFWSPDSQHIAFAAEGLTLKRMPAVGGSSVVLCDSVYARGGTWSRRGDILFGTADGPVFHVPASGGKATRVTQVDKAGGEFAHWYPLFLPDENRFLYGVLADDPEKRGVYLESLDHRHPKRHLVVADGFCNAIALDPEKKIYYLLSEQAGKIAAQIFDVDRGELSGPSRILLDRPGMLSVSDTGTLVIRKFGQDTSRLVWRDRTGRELGVLGTPDDYEGVHLSPDDRFVTVIRHESLGIHSRIWIASLPDGLLEPLSDSNRAVNPFWSADSKTVYYNDERRGQLLRRSVSPRGPEEVVMELGADRLTHVDGISLPIGAMRWPNSFQTGRMPRPCGRRCRVETRAHRSGTLWMLRESKGCCRVFLRMGSGSHSPRIRREARRST